MADTHVVQLLDINTANQIAAGEVVEKPASVVKELVENALDAGASQIDVTTYGGGTEYIRVVDNGCGMSEANARLAVLRHATSKIVKAEDLMSLKTLGFRGEALPSIASVSNFTLLTRPQDQDLATSVHIDGGENMEVTSTGGAAGTTVIVENLFFNVPARRKFLKTVVTEGRYISELLTKLALSRPDVRFKLVNNDKEVLHTPGDGDLQGTIRALYGRSVAQELLKVDFADPKLKITGFIGKPTLLKGTRQWQTLFVNGRSIGNKMLAKAIDHAYQSQIPKSGFPFAVLNIEIDTAAVDVNVHPQKSEIKFSDESLVYKAMFKALTDALSRPMSAQKTEITLLPDSELNAYVKPKQNIVQPSLGKPAAQPLQPLRGSVSNKNTRPPLHNPIFKTPMEHMEPIFKEPEGIYDRGRQETVIPVLEAREEFAKPTPSTSTAAKALEPTSKLVEPKQQLAEPTPQSVEPKQQLVETTSKAAEPASAPQPAAQQQTPIKRETIKFTDTDSGIATIWPIGQVDKTFIIAQSEDTLYLIDQHAAHERILYDKLIAAHEQVPAQQLLIPMYIDLAADEIERITAYGEEFLKLGVDVEAGGETMLRINSLPTDIKPEDAEDFIQEICKMLGELRQVKPSDLRQEVLHMTACKAAIKAGQLLTMTQMRQLIIDLCNTEHPFTCPHGRPCMIAIDSDQLYKMFKRTGF
ncbi:MAG: DNA mismatch repair endonuclease MutL [Phascolarctobacterium sp.]|nr:DNA mismatch repair endonuclease MutL [Phascolarctobacterium sp.]